MLIKDKIAWLTQALPLGSGDESQYLSYLHVINGVGYATDKHRMHVADIDLADGSYNPLTMDLIDASTLKDCSDLPAFVETLNNIPASNSISLTYAKFTPSKMDCRYIIYNTHNCSFSKLYVDQALNGAKRAKLSIINVDTNDLALLGSHKFGRFYVAGIKPRYLKD